MSSSWDFVVIGGGPAGVKAAQTAAEYGQRVLLVERGEAGGECVHRGTIPSKTMRETVVKLQGLQRSALAAGDKPGPETMVESMMGRLDHVLSGYSEAIRSEVELSGVELRRGRARLTGPNSIEIMTLDGTVEALEAKHVVLATGSRPRRPEGVPIDHEHILDSDSLLDLIYLPTSMTVLGAGVIASEFATVFQALGVQVTMVDRNDEPLAFVDREICQRFRRSFEEAGGRFIGGVTAESVEWNGESVVTRLSNGEELRSQKMLVAQGRTASVRGLGLEDLGIELSSRGLVEVDETYCTSVPGILAVGDVIGPPALAASSMTQGRNAVRHALGRQTNQCPEDIPAGIYTIPELAFVGLTEDAARKRHGDVMVGRAEFAGIARAKINGAEDGFLKLVADADGEKLLGVHVIGEGAIELVHLGQLARVGGLSIDVFLDQIFNFPTFAEAYRIAALDLMAQRRERRSEAA